MKKRFTLLAVTMLATGMTQAEDYLIRQGEVSVQMIDIDAVMNNIPTDTRHGVMDSPVRIQQYVQTLMKHRLMSRAAQAAMIGEDPLVQREIQQSIEKIMAKHFINHHLKTLKRPDYEQLAQERYLFDKDNYKKPASVDISHILISTKQRTDEEAIAEINALRKRVLAGEDFETLAREHSEDPSVTKNNGHLNTVVKGNMVPAFEETAFSLSEDNSLSDAVKTRFGYHLIQYHGSEPERQYTFDEVKAAMIVELEEEFTAKAREEFVDSFSMGGEEMEFNQAALEALRSRYEDGQIPGHEQLTSGSY